MLRVSWCAALLRSTGEFISGMGGKSSRQDWKVCQFMKVFCWGIWFWDNGSPRVSRMGRWSEVSSWSTVVVCVYGRSFEM